MPGSKAGIESLEMLRALCEALKIGARIELAYGAAMSPIHPWCSSLGFRALVYMPGDDSPIQTEAFHSMDEAVREAVMIAQGGDE